MTHILTVDLASGQELDVRDFSVEEGLSRLFEVRLTAVCPNVDVDFEAAVGGPARFEMHRVSAVDGDTRHWSGICVHAEQTGVEEDGLSTYSIRIVPTMWLLTQRRNYRVFQDKSELDIVLEILGEWGISPAQELDAGSYGKRRMRVQYAESDFDFVNRLLEDIGVTYHFEQMGGDTRLVLVDAPNRRGSRVPLPYIDKPNERVPIEHVTELRTRREVRPGRYTQSDVDYRRPLNFPLAASSAKGSAIEAKLERYHHNYGSFLWKGQGGDTPVADDRGAARTNQKDGARQVEKRLEAQRVDARVCRFRTTAHDLRPGKVITITEHPRSEVGAPQLVIACRFEGNAWGNWVHSCETRYTDVDYRPPLKTPKPRTLGVESATVTGPAGEEIHCDEFGRVRVHFHWDREGAADESSSCWVPVSQAWAGAGFGAVNLPRVGQEVLIDFLGADPDRPLVMGRVFTTTTPPPYQLPKYKMVSGLRSETYPRAQPGGTARMGGGPPQPVTMGVETPTVDMALPPHTPAAPAGGGMPLGQLGGSTGMTSMGSGSPGSTNAMPGIFGGTQAAPDELAGAVGRMNSLGPDQMDHHRNANGLVFDDQARNERVYLQGQNDLFLTVKRNFTGSVGANRAFSVLGNDYEDIPRGYQATKVGKDRTVEVTGKQVHTVQQDIIVDGKKNQIVRTKQDYYSETTDGGQVFQAKSGIMLRVGNTAAIVMTPDSIIIDAEKVYINPGRTMMEALYAGQSPDQAAAAQQSEDRINAATQAILQYHAQYGYKMGDQYAEHSLRATSNGASTPYSVAANRSGASPAEVRQAAGRAHDIMFVPQ